jgi:chemotaxis protein histidine kinase CheA
MHIIHDQIFHYRHLNTNIVDIEIKDTQEIRSSVDAQRSRFHQLISGQRALIGHASLEPTMWWFRNNFSVLRYESLAVQETDMFRMLHNVDAIVSQKNDILQSISYTTTTI